MKSLGVSDFLTTKKRSRRRSSTSLNVEKCHLKQYRQVNAYTRANIQLSQTGDKVNMCQAIIDMKQHAYERGYKEGEESGFQKGEESGFQKGEESLMAKIAHRMLSAKYDKQEISKMTGLSIQEIDKIVLV